MKAIITLLATAALLLMAACTADNLPTDPAAGTDPALTPGAVVTRIAEKPGYAPSPLEGGARRAGDVSTRTNPATGAWQTGEVVTARISFYSDDAGKTDDALLSEATQRLTYTAATAATTDADGKPLTAATPSKWSAVPALVSIPAKTRSLRVYYFYNGKPDPLTGTQERMAGYVTQASGSAIYPNAPTTPFPPTDNGYLIPIANATGTLALVPTFERQTAVVSLLMQPGQEVDFATAYIQPGWQFDESDKLYHRRASNTATDATTTTAHFHLDAPDEAYADANPDKAAKATFRLTLKDKPTETIYAAVPFRMGWQYQLDARTITGTGGGEGGNKQSVTATGLETLGTSVFNAQNPVWVITGGGDDADATKAVVDNVKAALIAARDAAAASGIPAGIELTLTSVKTLPTDAFFGNSPLTSLAAVHLPAATTIGTAAFASCTKLETVSATAATTIGMSAFRGCTALTLATLPAATTIEEGAFRYCAALSTISLNKATSIGSNAFAGTALSGTITLPAAKSIGAEAFLDCTALTALSLPVATSIGDKAFSGTALSGTISLPVATTIGAEAFSDLTSITGIDLPVATTFGANAFSNCTALSTLKLDAATDVSTIAFANLPALATLSLNAMTSIGARAFENCAALTTVSLNKATNIGGNAFAYCKALTAISLNAAQTIAEGAFIQCFKLATVSLPAATTIKWNAFASCTALTTVHLPVATDIGESIFNNCTALTALRLTAPGDITIGVNAFGGFNTGACTLTLHTDKQAGGKGSPLVESGNKWVKVTWKKIEYITPAPAPAARRR